MISLKNREINILLHSLDASARRTSRCIANNPSPENQELLQEIEQLIARLQMEKTFMDGYKHGENVDNVDNTLTISAPNAKKLVVGSLDNSRC